MSDDPNTLTTTPPAPVGLENIKFIHHRTADFRSVQFDGVWGSLDGYGRIHLSFFHEHPTIPQSIIVPVNKDGTLLNEHMRQQQEEGDVIREIEIDGVVSLETAKLIHKILGNFISLREQMDKDSQNK